MKNAILTVAIFTVLLLQSVVSSAQHDAYSPNFFPIAVFLQAPYNIPAYKHAGVNIYYDLSWGPLDTYHLNALHDAKMYVICAPDSFALTVLSDTLIYGWSMIDEPDNAQWNPVTNQYDSCIHPLVIIDRYQEIKSLDDTRPVILNLSQGVANLTWIGRGDCYNWIASYPTYNNGYLSGCDIGMFDIYPVNSTISGITDSLWYLAKGLDSLYAWSPNTQKPMWAWIETTKISSSSAGKPTPEQVRSEVWIALVHGAKGIGYFTHSWDPTYVSGAVLTDMPMVEAITALNYQISALAPVLNSPDLLGYATRSSSNAGVPIDILVKSYGAEHYIFTVAMRGGNTTGTFTVTSGTMVEVLGENRTIPIINGQFSDNFSAYGVHLYKITGSSSETAEILPERQIGMKVYPNPTESGINVEISRIGNATVKLVIQHLLGERVFEKELSGLDERYTFNLKSLHIEPGVYMISLQSEDYVLSEKIILY